MIPKGNQRGGGQNLATHLMNSYTNERVEIADVRGTVAQDQHGAFREWFAESKATKCTEYLYSLSINPDNRQGDLTRDQYMDFIARTEKKLGLAAQPRAVVFHIKKGREHCHVVWSRIDLEKMRAVPLGHDHQKLRSVVQEFARDHGLELPDGMKKDKGKDRYEDRQKDSNLREKQQEERTGETKQERMAAITEAWRQSDNAQAFVQALAGRGYHITRGDKGYVVVDRFGEIHFLGRQIQGAKTKDVTMRLAAEFPLDKLPAVEAVQQHIEEEKKLMLRAGAEKAQEAARAAAGKEQEAAREAEAGERSGKQKTAQPEKTQLTPAQRRAQLEEKQKVRRAVLDARRADMLRIHRIERQALRDMQDVQNTGVANDRLKHQPPGLAAFLLRITGIKALIRYGQDKARAAQHKQQQAALTRKHHREREDLNRQFHALDLVEKRELRAFQNAVRRDHFQEVAHDAREEQRQAARGAERKPEPTLTPSQRLRIQDFLREAGAATRPEPETELTTTFNRAADGLDHHHHETEGGGQPEKPPTMHELFNQAADTTEPETTSGEQDSGFSSSLKDSIRARSAQKRKARERETGKEGKAQIAAGTVKPER
jgi:hypothetical protein